MMNRDALLTEQFNQLNASEGKYEVGKGASNGALITHGIDYPLSDIISILKSKYGFQQFVSPKQFEKRVVGMDYDCDGKVMQITANQANFFRSKYLWACKKELLIERVSDEFNPYVVLGELSSEWLYVLMGLYYSCGGFKEENLTATIRFKSDNNGAFLAWIAKKAKWQIVQSGEYTELKMLDATNNLDREVEMSLFTGYLLKNVKASEKKRFDSDFFQGMSKYEKELFAVGLFYGSGSASWGKRGKNAPDHQRLLTRCVLMPTPTVWAECDVLIWETFLTSVFDLRCNVPKKANTNMLIQQVAIDKLESTMTALFSRFNAPMPKKLLQLQVIGRYNKINDEKSVEKLNQKMLIKPVSSCGIKDLVALSKSLHDERQSQGKTRTLETKTRFKEVSLDELRKLVPVAKTLKKEGLSATKIANVIMNDSKLGMCFEGCNPVQVRQKLIALEPNISKKRKG
jgi:hypothetical protein